uniref:cysteine dioxygenase n=1 Tax=Oryza brachyantha TaxID=4533 RepID=J3MW76_ORYBR
MYECENFTMVIFFLPQNAVIPLHDHPVMTGFSKLLIAPLHVRSYDWVDPEPAASCCNHLRLAKRVVNGAFTITGGNMHRFRARAPCAILDILGPPYRAVPYSRHSRYLIPSGHRRLDPDQV